MSSQLVFSPKERKVPSLRRGYRTPDPSPSRDAASLPGCVMNLFISAEEEEVQERGRARVAAFSRTPSPSPMARHDQKTSVNDAWENHDNACSTNDLMLENPFKQKRQLKLDELALPDNNLSEISTPRERARTNSIWADEVVEPIVCQDNSSKMPEVQMQDMSSKWSRERTLSPTPAWRGGFAPPVLPLSRCIAYTQQQQQPGYQQRHHVPVQLELAKAFVPTSPAIPAVPAAPPGPPRNSIRNRDRANSSQNPPRLVSRGSIGHPHQCSNACKYAWKKRGCKDGINCDRCHLCEWKRNAGHAS